MTVFVVARTETARAGPIPNPNCDRAVPALAYNATLTLALILTLSTNQLGWPERGSRIKPIYCLGDPAFWAGALCVAGVAGNASRGAYGARGQPGEGEYLDGLSDGGAASQAMDGKPP